jgi:catechol 2,3-dioxygenase-like lactoylglutathione lyase family enzyme
MGFPGRALRDDGDVTLTGHATVLLVSDVRRAIDYYCDALGFEVELYDRAPDHYGYARRDGCHVHLACFAGVRARPNSEVVPPDMFDAYFWADDVEALHAELVERGAEIVHGPIEQGYGQRELRLRDPDGHVLAFGEPI